jgi:ubiquinone/menaquinone biosynthesis C-methylase UbiE
MQNLKNTYEQEFYKYENERILFWESVYLSGKKSLKTYYSQKIIDIYKNIVPKGSSILEIGSGDGSLLASLEPSVGVGIDFSEQAIRIAKKNYKNLSFFQMDAHSINLQCTTFDFILLSELVNDIWDIQAVLKQIRPYCTPKTRIIFNFFSHAWSIPIRIARNLGVATPNLSQNWLTSIDLKNLLELSDYEILSSSREIIVPLNIPIITNIFNKYLSRIWPFEYFDFTKIVVARPLGLDALVTPSVSVIIAARNEAGHIKDLLHRIPIMGSFTEIIFVEGGSTDNTFEVIENEIKGHTNINCRLIKQTGSGKGNAVRDGFQHANGEILMILDADITVPPEDLCKFYSAITEGKGEFINGVRLV